MRTFPAALAALATMVLTIGLSSCAATPTEQLEKLSEKIASGKDCPELFTWLKAIPADTAAYESAQGEMRNIGCLTNTSERTDAEHIAVDPESEWLGVPDGKLVEVSTACLDSSQKASDELDIDKAKSLIRQTLDTCKNVNEWLSALDKNPGLLGMVAGSKPSVNEIAIACGVYPKTSVCSDFESLEIASESVNAEVERLKSSATTDDLSGVMRLEYEELNDPAPLANSSENLFGYEAVDLENGISLMVLDSGTVPSVELAADASATNFDPAPGTWYPERGGHFYKYEIGIDNQSTSSTYLWNYSASPRICLESKENVLLACVEDWSHRVDELWNRSQEVPAQSNLTAEYYFDVPFGMEPAYMTLLPSTQKTVLSKKIPAIAPVDRIRLAD
ncbi:hypothetical protein [Glutamicibacter uratoxydans]|uniref:hypothetical protein n=1 Tax=Glutamicibacter uratoxydans TaxID=43667 RepID=UPI003D6EC976